jgi:hypothetical protein
MSKQLKVYVTPVRSAPRPLRGDERVRRIVRIRLV